MASQARLFLARAHPLDPGNLHEGAGLVEVGVCVGGGVLHSGSKLSISVPSVWRLLWLLCGWGTGGEGWHCEVFEAGCLAQMSQAEGGVVISGEMSASSSSVCLGLEWQNSGFVEGVVPG